MLIINELLSRTRQSRIKLKKTEHAADVDTPDLATKKDFIALKAEVNKLYINKLVNVPIKIT